MQTFDAASLDPESLCAPAGRAIIRLDPPRTSPGGLWIPPGDEAKQASRCRTGVLIAVGAGVDIPHLTAAIGSRVWFVRRSTRDLDLGTGRGEDTFRIRGGPVFVTVPAYNVLATDSADVAGSTASAPEHATG